MPGPDEEEPSHEDTHGPGHGPSPEEEHGPPHEGHGPPHEEGRGPPHEEPPGGRFLINDERRRDLEQIGRFLQLVGAELEDDGTVAIGGETIRPSSTPFFVVRHERMPKGELKLLLEIEWNPRQTASPRAAMSDIVSEKTSMVTDRSREDIHAGDEDIPDGD